MEKMDKRSMEMDIGYRRRGSITVAVVVSDIVCLSGGLVV